MRRPVVNLRIVMQKLRRTADSLSVCLYQPGANRGLRFGTAARKTMGDEKDVGARAAAGSGQAISAAASVTRPSAESPAATMLFASNPAAEYICSGLA
jgi:hypothetical protein